MRLLIDIVGISFLAVWSSLMLAIFIDRGFLPDRRKDV
jgi:hypothetical protein